MQLREVRALYFIGILTGLGFGSIITCKILGEAITKPLYFSQHLIELIRLIRFDGHFHAFFFYLQIFSFQ